MSKITHITILKEEVPAQTRKLPIDDLRYLKENPRIISLIDFDDGETVAKIQERIHDEMKKQSSVIDLKPSIRSNGGLNEPILVRADRNEVVEGNSRLAAYKLLYEETKDERWKEILCLVVPSLTDDQQFAYLNQIHVVGKTPWVAYEKANMAYNYHQKGKPIQQIAGLCSTTEAEIQKRIDVVDLMKKNGDDAKEHFSYYNDCLVRNKVIAKARAENPELNRFLLKKIKNFSNRKDGNEFTALELRNKLPRIIDSKKKRNNPLDGFMSGELSLKESYARVELSTPNKKIKQCISNIGDIVNNDIKELNGSDLNRLESDVKKLQKIVNRIVKMAESEKDNRKRKD